MFCFGAEKLNTLLRGQYMLCIKISRIELIIISYFVSP